MNDSTNHSKSNSSLTLLWSFAQFKVRLLDGSTLSSVFKAQEPLAAVRVYIQMNGENGQDFNLITPYPRRVFTDLDMEKPLCELGKNLYKINVVL